MRIRPARTVAAACVLFVVAHGRVSAGDDGVSAALTLDRTTFLSSEKPTATLTVVNHSPSSIEVHLGEIIFQSFSGGRWQESRACVRSCWRWSIQVRPGAQAAPKTALPTCDVLPVCTEDVIAQFEIASGGSLKRYRTRLPQYRIVPDPTATYDIDGLRGNRPVFVTYGCARQMVFPASMLLVINVSSGASNAFAVLRRAGVTTTQAVWTTEQSGNGPITRAYAYVEDAVKQRAAVDAALQTLKNTPGVEGVSEESAFDPRPLWSDAESVARRHAQTLAELLRVGNDDDWLVDGTMSRTLAVSSDAGGMAPQLDASNPFSDRAVLARPKLSSVIASATVRGRYVGSNPASTSMNGAVAGRAAGALRWPAGYLPLEPAVTTVADRPELYTVGAAYAPAALNEGLSPEFAALVGARAAAEQSAALLGVRLGTESLLLLYPLYPGDDYPRVGLATTFSGGDPGRWRDAPSDPHVITESLRPADLGVPIAVSHPDATISEAASATPSGRPLSLRFQANFNSHADRVVVDAASLVRRLRRMRGVVEAAETTRFSGGNARYDVVLKASDRSIVPGLASFLQKAYATADSEASFDLSPFVANCAALRPRLLKAAIRKSWLLAEAEARAKHRRLDKLISAAALPGADDVACGAVAQPPGPLPHDDADHFSEEDTRSIPVFMRSLMIFRTDIGLN